MNLLNKNWINEFENYVLKKFYVSIDDQVVWNLETVKKFIDCLIDTTSTKEISDLNHKVFDKQVWSEMKKRLNIDSKRLKTFWYLQLQRRLFCPAVSHLNDIKLKIMTL